MQEAERAAAQAYIRLLAATRAALADPADGPLYMPLLASPIQEADEALHSSRPRGQRGQVLRSRPGAPAEPDRFGPLTGPGTGPAPDGSGAGCAPVRVPIGRCT